MELTKKTTILFTPEQHRQLTEQAARRGVSLGELVRAACLAAYGLGDRPSRVEAVSALAALSLPLAAPEVMKRESTPAPGELLP